ncbi:pectinesterase family protein [Chryseobacterium sp. FH1]|uniref:pectinesterase family protein n=1 Tax=Chryseobacterium sp. FH1 TaxID=1233951 RepID=UPI0004E3AF81|nr:pectinesterase family protein [Chryseobacterium sp. FH1]KFC21632.1 pectin esterase [Chryseobacterium sp. FH1]
MKKITFIFVFLFSILAMSQNPYVTITVAQDGSGQFTSIQKAINSLRDLGPGEALIKIKSGVYKEKVVIPSSKHQITLEGEDKETTIITNDDYSGKLNPTTNEKLTTFDSYTVLVVGDDIKISNITIQNTWCNKGQAVSLHVEGDRFVMRDSKLLGCQDTLYTAKDNSRQYYENCYIEGTTDFIFGQATAVFKNCEIRSLSDSYITASATSPQNEFGFVFFDCHLTAKEGVSKVFLGRPWRPFAKTVFINTTMENHILPEGWNPWKGDKMFPEKEKTAFYAEFGSKGKGANPSKRVAWSHQLSKKEIKKYTIENIFKKSTSWNPSK